MPNFVAKKEVNNKKMFNEIYRQLFRSIMLRYNSLNNKSLEAFLRN